MKQVAESVKSLFKDHFHGSPEYLVRAPGRVNLIGEHTDYNMGYVLPVAIDRNIWVAFRPRSDDEIHLYSLDFNESIHIADLDSLGKSGNWSDYILGTVWELNRQGFPSRGWEGIIAGDIPIGAGLSSSAATEIAIADRNTVNRITASSEATREERPGPMRGSQRWRGAARSRTSAT